MKQSCGPAGPSLQLKPQPWFSGHVIGAEAPLPVPSGLSQNPSGVNGPLALCPLELLAYHLRQLPLGWVCCPGYTGEPVWASCSGQSWLAQGPGLWSSLHLPTGGFRHLLNALGLSLHVQYGKYEKQGFPAGSDGKESACSARDPGSIPGLRRSPGEGNGYPLQYFCLEKFMDRGTWQATVHGVTKSGTQLSY